MISSCTVTALPLVTFDSARLTDRSTLFFGQTSWNSFQAGKFEVLHQLGLQPLLVNVKFFQSNIMQSIKQPVQGDSMCLLQAIKQSITDLHESIEWRHFNQ